jgi:RNA polymerase sigma factor (sigma-70 family)
VTRARDGDKQAWDALVERYAPLIWSICHRHRLSRADAEDVGQSVWLQLVDQLDKIRDPAALPGWLATTTRRACGKVLRGPRAARYGPDVEDIPHGQARTAEQEVLTAERHAALREAYGDLPPLLPAADRHAHRRPSGAIRRDQCQTWHAGRQHRALLRPLPGQAAPSPGDRSADQRRSRDRNVSYPARIGAATTITKPLPPVRAPRVLP